MNFPNWSVLPIKLEVIAKENRRKNDYRYGSSNKVTAVRWNDNRVVILASNCQPVNTVVTTKPWMVGSKYFMLSYSWSIQKITDAFFMFFPDTAVQSAWLLYRSFSSHYNEPMDLPSFCREIVNICRMKYLSQQRIHVLAPTNVALFIV